MYDLLAVDFQTGARLGRVRYATLEWREVLCDVGDWSCSLEAHDPGVGLLLPGCTLVYVHDPATRTIVYAGIVWRLRRLSSATVEVSGSSLLSYLGRRVMRDTFSGSLEQFDIVAQLILEMQAVAGGTLHLTVVRTPTNSGVVRAFSFLASDLVTYGDALSKLAELDRGFEYGISAAWSGSTIAHTLTLGYPRLGTDLNIVWADGVDVVVDQTEDDRSDYATWWRARGGGDTTAPTVDIGPATQPVVARGFPVLESAQTYSDLLTTALLTAQGTADQRASHVETMTVALSAASRWPPGHWHVGDSVRIVSASPSVVGLDGATWWRIGGYTASIDEDGQLVVSLDVDKARNNARPVLRPLDRLERVRADTARRLAVVENTKA